MRTQPTPDTSRACSVQTFLPGTRILCREKGTPRLSKLPDADIHRPQGRAGNDISDRSGMQAAREKEGETRLYCTRLHHLPQRILIFVTTDS